MINENVSRIIKYPLLVAFSVFVVGMLFTYILKTDSEFSPMENRYLKGRPQITIASLLDGSFMDDFETYSEEQLPLRDMFIKMKAVCEMVMLKQENNGIIRGSDGFLFEKTVAEGTQLDKNIMIMSAFAESTDRHIYIAVSPNSSAVYSDKLPVGAKVLDERSAKTSLERSMADKENVSVIDLWDVLSDTDEQLFYRTDHHWTSQGAYRGYCKIAQAMEIDVVDVSGLEEHQVTGFYGTYYSKYKGIGIEPDVLTYYDVRVDNYEADGVSYQDIYDMEKLSVYDKYAMFMYGNPALAHICGTNKNGRSLVVLKDSYANSILPFLACSYENITVVDLRYFGQSVSDILEEQQDSDILLMYNWSFVNEDNHFYKLVK